MGITYNTLITPSHVYRLTGAVAPFEAGTFSGNLSNTTANDYFVAAAAVGDCFYFGHSPRFDDIQLNIGTALAAATLTGVWEYYNGAGWAALTVTDPTAGFTVTGQKTVAFVPPDNWRGRAINGQTKMWVRYRLTAIAGQTSKAANATSVDRVGNNIWVITGYTEGSPCSLTTLAAAYPNEIVRLGTTLFYVRGAIVVGDDVTSSWFIDTLKAIEFPQLGVAWSTYSVLWAKANATCRLGAVRDATLKLAERGCTILVDGGENAASFSIGFSSGGAMELLGCTFAGCGYTFYLGVAGTKIWECLLPFKGYLTGLNVDVNRVTVCYGYAYLMPFTGTPVINDVFAYARHYMGTTGITVSNSTIIFDAAQTYIHQMSPSTGSSYFIDSVSKKPNGSEFYDLQWYNCPYSFNRLNSLTLKVVDKDGLPISGAVVSLKDVFGADITGSPFTADVNGKIDAGAILFKKYVKDPAYNTYPHLNSLITTYGPHTLTITAPGYQDYQDVITIDRKMDLEVAMKTIEQPPGPWENFND